MTKTKLVEAVKLIRNKEKMHYEKGSFCREHNFKLDQIYHNQMEQELGSIARNMENLFDVGYVRAD